MLKNIISTITAIVAGTSLSLAVPAYPGIIEVAQPDGSTLLIQMHGDEYLNFVTTSDGFTVSPSANGYRYVTAFAADVPALSEIVAHNPEERSKEETDFLRLVQKQISPVMSEHASREKRLENHRRIKRQQKSNAFSHDYSDFKGLVVLIEFNDREFLRDDTYEFFNSMLNDRHYTGYATLDDNPQWVECTGSVRDYFFDNSNGVFEPEFTIAGPVRIDYSVFDVNKYIMAQEIGTAALKELDKDIDFSDYDTDHDGIVDMVYFIYAGGGSNTGNDGRLLWPHASSLADTGLMLDGVAFDSYACSTELTGLISNGVHDGIGTICHEFSHVLGLFDVYDTDYSGGGGLSVHPAHWSIMASGSYLNNSRTPCGYSMFERMAAGFASPTDICESADLILAPLDSSNEACRISSRVENEYFIIENRQQQGWDTYLPGHGMLVFRVDLTSPDVWDNNTVNNNPAHNYYELIRACPVTDRNTGTITDSPYDPFPGNGGVTAIGNRTQPSLRSWTGLMTDVSISEIYEHIDGTVSFHAEYDPVKSTIEDFESISPASGDISELQGCFCSWFLKDCEFINTDESGYAIAFRNRNEVSTSLINSLVQTMSFELSNCSSEKAQFRLYCRKNDSGNWIALKDYNLNRDISVEPGKKVYVQYDIDATNPTSYRFVQSGGSSSEYLFLDNVAIEFNETVGIKGINREQACLEITRIGGILTISTSDSNPVQVFSLDGTKIYSVKPHDGKCIIETPATGLYIVSQSHYYKKVFIR